LLVIAVAAVWLLRPIERSVVAIAPVVNQTGRVELDTYRLALTEMATARVAQARDVRPIPYRRVLQALQRFSRGENGDITSRDAVQSIATDVGAPTIVIPTLLYDSPSGAWRARVEFRNVNTATNLHVAETAPIVSTLSKDTVYELANGVGAIVSDYFASVQTRVRTSLGSMVGGREARLGAASMRTLDAVEAFERGIRAYEALEYADALQAFQSAAALDSRHPSPPAWMSRIARLQTQWDTAREAGDRAVSLLTATTAPTDVLFAQAVSAEARRDNDEAGEKYRALSTSVPDEPFWLLELAAFQDRAGKTADAVASYHTLLERDPQMIRPHLELCRLYNSTRMNESGLARQHGGQARDRYAAVGDEVGEGLALLCLADILRVGSSQDRVEARRAAEQANTMFEHAGAQYNLARSFHYIAVTSAREDPVAAVAAWEKSLALAEKAKNTTLEATVLVNLGTANRDLGNRTQSVAYYRRSSQVNEARGDEQGAAYSLANAGALLIDYGMKPDEGLRDVQNALAVVQKIDKNFEAFCLRNIAKYHRQIGRRAEAERELRQAEAIARERGLDDDLAAIAIELGYLYLDVNEYEQARTYFRQAADTETGSDRIEAQIGLARVHVLLGDFTAAERVLGEASAAIEDPRNKRLLPVLHLTRGLLASESGKSAAARQEFARAASSITTDLVDEASVEARAHGGWLDARAGHVSAGQTAIAASVDDARRMRRSLLEARCRILLARVLLRERRAKDALAVVAPVPVDQAGFEMRAQLHHLRADAYRVAGESVAAEGESMLAADAWQQLRRSVRNPDDFAHRDSMTSLIAGSAVR
jgi:tetratricopeptide (TPR) repeat protein